ncbi:hypothetical protein [Neorhodopirellula lusitana]|uniref:hypothetical protein n=1 Tax=Neorhodopirellula lusitana TaxID=445327 RepID=UPI00384D43EE
MSAASRHDEVSIRLKLLVLLMACFAPGCSLFSMPTMKMPDVSGSMMGGLESAGVIQSDEPGDSYLPVGGNVSLQSSSFTQDVYQAVRKAKESNSIVMQVVGDQEPIRVLPLPAAADISAANGTMPTGIFVSTLLKQTGVIKKLGRVEAALYRPSPASFEGVRMDIQFSPRQKDQIRPESDYALRPGDRIIIRRDERVGFDSLVDLALGR